MHNWEKPELVRLLEVAAVHDELHWLALLVAYWHGLRASEVTNMTGQNIADGYLIIQRLKGSEKTVQPLIAYPDAILSEKEPLEARAKEVGNGLMFPFHRSWFWAFTKKYGKLAGIPAHLCHPHAAKHSIAMHLLYLNPAKKISLPELQKYLGHVNISSTGQYTKVSNQQASSAVHSILVGE